MYVYIFSRIFYNNQTVICRLTQTQGTTINIIDKKNKENTKIKQKHANMY